ncbi:MAG: helix-turn-helix domain-containing protein [Verrucomicrobiae bacterium]|nr:helix-turn-helix domain-containing protein [Verrucomicrobiae bacterium]
MLTMPRPRKTSPDFFHYLPVTDRDMRLGLYVTGAGRSRIRPGAAYPPAGHPDLYDFNWNEGRVLPEFQVILITRGRGEFESRETGRFAIGHNTLLLLFPDTWHRYRPSRASGWQERWISLNGEFAHRMQELGLIAPGRAARRVPETTDLAAAFDRTLDRIHADPMRQSPLMLVGAIELLALAAEFAAPPQDPFPPPAPRYGVTDPLVAAALDLIWTHSHRHISVAQIADRMGVPRRTLERRTAAALGRTVLDEIHRCRLTRAQRLLQETNLPIKMVAYLAGFHDGERLRLLLRQAAGCSPAEYRERARQPIQSKEYPT